MIDLHAHLLYGVDDGPAELEAALKTLALMAADGITDAVATSHYIRGHYSTNRSLIDDKVAELRRALAEHDIAVNVHAGAEVLITPEVLRDVTSEQLVMAGTDYVLVECELNSLPPNLDDLLYRLNLKGFRPILAHPERYGPIINDPRRVEELVNRNTYMQINAQSLLGGYGRRVHDTAWGFIEDGLAHFVASDTHCRGDSHPLAKAAGLIRTRIDDKTASLLTVDNPAKLLRNEAIDYTYVRFVRETPRSFWQKIGDALWNR